MGFNEVFKKNVKASFNKYFPIHFIKNGLDEDSLLEMGLDLKPVHRNFTKDDFFYTQVYYKKEDEPDTAWNTIDKLGKGKKLSPYHNIRVIVILRKDIRQEIYPISLQVVRSDFCNTLDLSGPLYKSTVTILSEKSLLSGEKHFKGYLGFIFYPIYKINIKTIGGIKPLAHGNPFSDMAIIGPRGCYLLGFFKHMFYYFRVKAGGGVKNWQTVRLGGKMDVDKKTGQITSLERSN